MDELCPCNPTVHTQLKEHADNNTTAGSCIAWRIGVPEKEEQIFCRKFPGHATPETREGEIMLQDIQSNQEFVCPLQFPFANCLVGKLSSLQ